MHPGMHTGRRSCEQEDTDRANGYPSPGRPRMASKPSEAREAGTGSLAAPEGTTCAHTQPSDGASRAAREERLPCPHPGVVLYYSSPGNQHRHRFKVYNSVTVSILKYRAVVSTAQLWSMFTSQRKRCFLLPRALATTNLRPIALDVPVLGILSTWNRTIRGLCVLFPSLCKYFQGSPCCSMNQTFITLQS